MADNEYYRLSEEELIDLFGFSRERGLSRREIRSRQYRYGSNKIVDGSYKGVIAIFFDQFRDFMILVLMVATLLSFLMGEFGDGVTISAIIILNGIMGFIQEYRAEKSLAALKRLTAPRAKVIRDGRIEEVAAEALVPGDLLLVETGDRIPADARIINSRYLEVDESLLTGESLPVSKNEQLIYARGLDLGVRSNMLFMGTTVTRGRARAVVVNIGMDTEMGRIAALLDNNEKSTTPLQRRLNHLGKWLVVLSLAITVVISVLGILKGQSIYQMILAGVSLAVAAIPEGLPAIVTLVLALGVQKMIKNRAIVRRLSAVETLGCATVICSDKTGTLTQNQMALSKYYQNNRISPFETGVDKPALQKMIRIGALCSSVKLKEEESEGTLVKVRRFFTGLKIPEMIGDPTEVALVRALYHFKDSFTALKEEYRVSDEEEFTPSRKRMSVLIETPEKARELWLKGAPEVVLELTRYVELNGEVVELNRELRDEIVRASSSMAQDALRVLAIAYRPIEGRVKPGRLSNLERELIFCGLVGLLDPPRPEVYQAVQSCFRAGIKPMMITGDHQQTARVIAEELGIINRKERVITGSELRNLEDQELKQLVGEVKVYARISPEDKLRIVRALKDKGEVVAMTGDGINDAPAIKEADIGIAMGETGTDVTKEVASLILADDNFATIVRAVEEGRKIYNNIRKFIRYLLSCNTGELLAIFTGVLLGLPLPLLPIQILWVNLVTDGLPALALGLDEDSDLVMERPPRNTDESIFAGGMVSRIITQGSLIGISTITAYLVALFQLGADLPLARTMAFSTLVFSQLFFVFSCRSERHSIWQISPFANPYLIGAVLLSTLMQLAVIYLPYPARFFQTVYLGRTEWIIVITLSIWSTILLDFIYYWIRRVSSSD